MERLYHDRHHAGAVLATMLKETLHGPAVIIALPRGGVPVAGVVADFLGAPLDVLVVRKIGAPRHPEYGLGAMAEDEIPLWGVDTPPDEIQKAPVQAVVNHEKLELRRRVKLYRQGHALMSVRERVVVLVDDGLATGTSAAAAAHYLRGKGARRIILAVPVGPSFNGVLVDLYVDQVVCPLRPEHFHGVGLWYEDFSQVTDEEVLWEMQRSRGSRHDVPKTYPGHPSA